MIYLQKWIQTMKVAWARHTAYRLNFFLQVIGPALVFFFIKYNLWNSIYRGDTQMLIKNMTLPDMIQYHVWALIVSLIASGHSALNLSEEIRMGRISTYLIYPFNFWEFHTASFFSFQILQFFIASFTIAAITMMGLVTLPSMTILMHGFLYCLFVSIFWFTLQYFTGLLSFWLEETWILRVLLMILTSFLSGAIIPLDLFPPWLVVILNKTPFPYLAYYPIKIFGGDLSLLGQGYLIMGAWAVCFLFINSFVWRKGLRLYTAAGM